MNKTFPIIARGVLVISAVTIVSVSATFAALTSNPVFLQTNSMTVATPGLQIGRDGTFSSTSITGFNVTNLYPSNSYTNAGSFQLKNTSPIPLRLNVRASNLPTTSTISPTVLGLAFQTQIVGGSGGTTGSSLSQAISPTGVTLVQNIGPGETMNITLQVNLASTADVTSNATTGSFNFTFTGTQVAETP